MVVGHLDRVDEAAEAAGCMRRVGRASDGKRRASGQAVRRDAELVLRDREPAVHRAVNGEQGWEQFYYTSIDG